MVAPTRENARKKKEREANNPTAPTRENASRLEQERQPEQGQTMAADKNAALLAQFGSPEAKAFNDRVASGEEPQEPQPQSDGDDADDRPLVSASTPSQSRALDQAQKDGLVKELSGEFLDQLMSPRPDFQSIAGGVGALAGIGMLVAGGGRLRAGRQAARSLLPQSGKLTSSKGSIAETATRNPRAMTKIKEGVGNWLRRKETVTTTTASGRQTVKTVTRSGNMVSPGLLLGTGAALAFAATGTMGAAFHNRMEAIGGLGATIHNSLEHGNLEGAREAAAAMNEMTDVGTREMITSLIPGVGVVDVAINEGFDQAKLSSQIYLDIISDMETAGETSTIARSNGEGEATASSRNSWTVAQERKAQLEQELEQQRFENEKRLIELRNEAKAADRADQAAYWENQLQQRLRFEEEKLRLQREYWDQYYKRKAQLSNATAPSQLGFGLL